MRQPPVVELVGMAKRFDDLRLRGEAVAQGHSGNLFNDHFTLAEG